VLGLVTVARAWYHCAECGYGLAPRDAELSVARASMSPGLAAMNDQAAAAVPFAEAVGLLENLARVRLTAKHVVGAAEASGAAVAAAAQNAPGLSPPAGWCRCRPPRSRTSCMRSSTAPASR
jgi:hypothetical protein